MKNFIILIILIFYNFLATAQGTLEDKKSPFDKPNTSSHNSGEIVGSEDIDLYRGKVSTSIPIYKLKGRDLAVNIDINYRSGNGIKVQDVAGLVGLGWSIASGGVITRRVKGEPDDIEHRYYLGYGKHDNAALYGDTTGTPFKNYILRATNELLFNEAIFDIEPDEFHSSIGGNICFGMNRSPFFCEENGFKILKNGLYNADSTWVILDRDGNSYYFGKNASEREHTKQDQKFAYISAWYLSEIRSPNGDIIQFVYEKGLRECDSYYSRTNEIYQPGMPLLNTSLILTDNICRLDPVYLTYIKSNTHQAHFIYNKRLDNNSRCLSKIVVEDLASVKSKVFQFNYGYFKAEDGNTPLHLKLLSIDQLNSQESARLPIASFEYVDPTFFTSRNSPKMDHWGYFNANSTGQWFPSKGADKNPNLEKAKMGILKSISLGTGGITQFEYELNSFIQDGQEVVGGGLRVSKVIKKFDSESQTFLYKYTNASGKSSGLLNGYFYNNLYYRNTYYNIRHPDNDLFSYQGNGTIENSSPLTNFFDETGAAVCYSEVTVENPGGSKIKNIYLDRNKYKDEVEGTYQISNLFFRKTDNSFFNTVKGFYDFPSRNKGLRGKLSEQQIISSTGKIIKRTVWDYRLVNPDNGNSSIGMQRMLTGIHNSQTDYRHRSTWYMVYYNNKMYTPQLLTKKEYEYSSDELNKVVENTTRYVYKSFNFMPSQVITSTATADSAVLEYRYPLQASTNVSDINYKLYEKNMLIPVETVMKIKTGSVEKVVGSTANVYADFDGRLMLQSQYSLDLKTPISNFSYMDGSSLDSRYRLKTVYDKYAKSGELLQYHENFGPPVSLVWGMKNSILLAKITGIDYDGVKANLDTLNLNKLTATQGFVTSELAKIRALNKTLNITSNYTHPITGVLASIDNTGRSETYTYDQFGRLSSILDTKQNIVRSYVYNIFDLQANDLDVSKWIKTGNTRCVTVNGTATGEEEVEEKYTDASNINNNKLRWRSIGYTNKCIIN